MKHLLSLIFLIISYSPSFCQLYDNTWMFGYDNNSDTTDHYGISVMTFERGKPHIFQNSVPKVNFDCTNSSYSDSLGNLLFFSNGVHIYNKKGEIMEGGENVMDGDEVSGSLWPQYISIIPFPDHADQFIVLYQTWDYSPDTTIDVYSDGLYFSVVDLSKNNGLGQVLVPQQIIIQDTLRLGHIMPVRHANGRDWWLLLNEINSNRFYKILIDHSGVSIVGTQTVGVKVYDGLGQSCFSPDGNYYCSFVSVSQEVGSYIDIYNFDRCTGLLSNHRQSHLPRGRGGVAVSPNSRYLYHNYSLKAYQYDLYAPDILTSRTLIAEWDGYYSPFAAGFGLMQLAPDGKIYSETVSSTNVLHVIHHPDEPGVACMYEQHGIHLPTYNSFSLPSFPNYRLGPLDGSPCDTLGINNNPVAWWRSEQDTLNAMDVQFTDLSYHEPATWLWNFGDSSSGSSQRNPQHVFGAPGVYTVCLTVSNINGEHTFCRKLFLGVTAQENPVLENQIQVGPNPFRTQLSITCSTALRNPQFRLYDALGRLVAQSDIALVVNEIDTNNLRAGMYFWEVLAGQEVIKTGKVVKID